MNIIWNFVVQRFLKCLPEVIILNEMCIFNLGFCYMKSKS